MDAVNRNPIVAFVHYGDIVSFQTEIHNGKILSSGTFPAFWKNLPIYLVWLFSMPTSLTASGQPRSW